MSDYSQPSFYRFNEDSLKLLKFVLSQEVKAESLVDLCAGCGIIGIEAALSLGPGYVEFVEIQYEFRIHLEKNLSFLPDQRIAQCSFVSLAQWRPEKKFDLILCNPPYYLPGRGVPSVNVQKDLARRFSVDGWRVLLEKTSMALAPAGQAFYVIPQDPHILGEIEQHLGVMKFSKSLIGNDLMIVKFWL